MHDLRRNPSARAPRALPRSRRAIV